MFWKRKRKIVNGSGETLLVSSQPNELDHELWFFDTVSVARGMSKGDMSGPLSAAMDSELRDAELSFASAPRTVTRDFWERMYYFGYGKLVVWDAAPNAKLFYVREGCIGLIASFVLASRVNIVTDEKLQDVSVLLKKNRTALAQFDSKSLIDLVFLFREGRKETMKAESSESQLFVALLEKMHGVDRLNDVEWRTNDFGNTLLPFLFDHILKYRAGI